MGDQTKSMQILSIEHRKHNQLDIRYLHQLFIKNPQLGCLASHYKKTLNNNEITKHRLQCTSCSPFLLLGLFSPNRPVDALELCALGVLYKCVEVFIKGVP